MEKEMEAKPVTRKWTWIDGTGKPGAVVLGDAGPTTSFKWFTESDLSQWLYAVDRANDVFGVLLSARANFEKGLAADYENSCSRLHRLINEIEKAGIVLLTATREISRFFEDVPQLKESIAALSPEELDQFVRETVPLLHAEQGSREEKKGS